MEVIIQGNKCSYTRLELFTMWQQCNGTGISEKNEYLLNEITKSFDDSFAHSQNKIMQNVRRYCSELSKRWIESNRTKAKFLKKNELWLKKEVSISNNDHDVNFGASTSGRGRPTQAFKECSNRSKRRKTKSLCENFDSEQLKSAIKRNLRSESKFEEIKLMNEALDTTPTRSSKIRKSWVSQSHAPVIYTPEEALALIVEAGLTKEQYSKIRLQAKERHADIYPPYNMVREAKKKCYPKENAITISDTSAKVNLQALLDHTVERIVESQKDVINNLNLEDQDFPTEWTLILKWGCDGSSGHSLYKQKLNDGDTDSCIFSTSIVPLKLHTKKSSESESSELILWQNPRTSSVRYCRPVHIQYKKETTSLAQEEIMCMEKQIDNLNPFSFKIGNITIKIQFQMLLTMIDGKICNAATSTTSSQICYICKATPKQMNNIKAVVQKDEDVSTFRFGLSTLHAWIRFMECLLHISYKIPIKKWQARGECRDIVNQRKSDIQAKFREKLGILIDQVKVGSGTTNDGNTARTFFKNPEISSEITGIDLELIKRCHIILSTLSCGFKIDSTKFEMYAKQTAQIFVELYPWYYMPTSMHKILIHGAKVIEHAILPIGQLSEEAQECQNKCIRMYRRCHTRKISRIATNEDLLHNLLISSDPYISGLRILNCKRSEPFKTEVLNLLLAPTNCSAE